MLPSADIPVAETTPQHMRDKSSTRGIAFRRKSRIKERIVLILNERQNHLRIQRADGRAGENVGRLFNCIALRSNPSVEHRRKPSA